MKAGEPVIFKWGDRELTGILCSYPKPGKWLRVRTKGREFQVPPEDVRDIKEKEDD